MKDLNDAVLVDASAINRKFSLYKGAVVVVFAIWMALSAAIWWRAGLPSAPYARVINVTPLSPTAVCPGDELVYQLHVDAKGPVVLDLDVTTWNVDDRDVVATSDTWRIVLPEAMERPVVARWNVPDDDIPPGEGVVSIWGPGQYQRVYAIGTPFRNSEPSVATLPFTVREDCK